MAKALGPYTPVLAAGGWLAVSGQLGLRDGTMVPGGIADEVTQAIANIAELLASLDASLGNVVKTTVYLRHMRDYPLMNEAYTAAFGDHRPARAAVAVVELPALALVEIDAWAYVGDR
jgi:2-iminobutanoate/2-iminopropanoate deaminase